MRCCLPGRVQYVYDIGGNYYSLLDLSNGILLANLSLPQFPFGFGLNILLPRRKLENEDPRAACRIRQAEPLLHLCLSSGTASSGRIAVYRHATLHDQIRAEAANYLQRNIEINSERRRVFLPELLQWFETDFRDEEAEGLVYLARRLPQTDIAQFIEDQLRKAEGKVRPLACLG